MKNIFEFAEHCLHSDSIDEKLSITDDAWKSQQQATLDYTSVETPHAIEDTVFPERPLLVSPRQLPRRSLSTPDGRIALLHSLAHIEFYAIHLAWDILYRFRQLPTDFYSDWLRVAAEEALHFSLLRNRLQTLNSDYGVLPAHRGLWDVASDTTHDVLARLALVPRTLEARGLDVSPGMIQKLLQCGDTLSAEILERIMNDEIGHVEIGSRWFRFFCAERGLDSETVYFDFLHKFMKGKVRGPINRELRKQAGFSEHELDRLQGLE